MFIDRYIKFINKNIQIFEVVKPTESIHIITGITDDILKQ